MEIMSLEFAGVKLRDSLCFLPMPLSSFPKALGFDAAKGYFPHLFNKMENMDYVGAYPPAEDYGILSMKTADRKKFMEWYEQQTGVFDFKQQLEHYCRLDVEILAKGCLTFREMLMKQHNVCPFSVAMTIASLCMHVYRKKFLPKNTIGIIPHRGYRANEKQSITAIKWLKWLSEKNNWDIQHARNGREVRVLNYKLDGASRTDPKQLFEFHG